MDAKAGDDVELIAAFGGDPVRFVRETLMPDAPMDTQIAAIVALYDGKRVCVWRDEPTVYRLFKHGEEPGSLVRYPSISHKDTDDLHQPAGEYGDGLVIIDLWEPEESVACTPGSTRG
jgi:hypothetical protein